MNNFGRQTWALTKKNFTIIVVRSWFWTAFRALILPILLVTLLLEIPNLSRTAQHDGVGNPAPARSLAQSMDGSKKLAIVQTRDLASDAKDALKRLMEPLDKNLVMLLDDSNQLLTACNVDYRGSSNCHAVITFNDSPESGRVDATWNYTIQVDPSKNLGSSNTIDHSGLFESFWLPLQVAIDNAIANRSETPESMSYNYGDQKLRDEDARHGFLILSLYILSFVFFISMATVVHHLSSIMSSERGSGLSQLTDAMGGGAVWPRIFSYVVFFDLLYLPLWIILGCLIWHLLLPKTNPVIVIFWQIFTGWATTSATAFGTAWFRRSASGTVVVTGLSVALAAVAAVIDNLSNTPAGIPEVAVLSLFFPSMNYVFFFSFAGRSELYDLPTYMTAPLPMDKVFDDRARQRWVFKTGPYFLWIILAVQIIVFPLLAVLVEHKRHGNNRHRRTFNTAPGGDNSHITIEATDLEMHFRPSIWRRIFCCARKPSVKAVDGLSLTSQKGQLLCLLGPNGSGKTTTLDMIAGFQKPTGGSINVNALPSQIGVCPQKNVLWDNLTVYEHLVFWNTVKNGTDSNESLERLIQTCDLAKKRDTFAKNLSGGMKRKLQLACMLVGGSSVCLMDEVTSGLDPISRRVIWNAVLKERSRRTMVFTTHFLDESEVLSDHIVIISLGKVKCQGTPAELKNQYGAGYRVHLPKTADVSDIPYPVIDNSDRYVCTTPDSSSAARLITTIRDSKASEVFITGPTIEDVFLKVSHGSDDLSDSASEGETIQSKPGAGGSAPDPTASHQATFSGQVRALFLKRFVILRSQWWIYFFVLAIPLVITPLLKDFLVDYEQPVCQTLIGEPDMPYAVRSYGLSGTVLGPLSANETIFDAANSTQRGNPYGGYSGFYGGPPPVVNDRNGFIQYIHDHAQDVSSGGIFIDNSTTPLIAYRSSTWTGDALSLTNIFNMARTGVEIHILTGTLRSLSSYNMGSALIWSTIFCLIMALYPAFFCLYPTYERLSKVRALQYSNGVRALPLWLSYMLFDLIFVLVISILCTALISSQASFWSLGHIWFIQFLYGIAAMLVAYVVSTFSSSQPAAIAWSILIMIVEYVLSIITMVVVQDGLAGNTKTVDGTTYGLGLIFPIQNLMRAMALSLNQYIVRCRGTTSLDNPGDFHAYGGPICFLIIQIFGLFFLLLWLDGTVFNFSRPKDIQSDEEKSRLSSGRPDVDTETARVSTSESDLLRMLHISKKFGSKAAVEDVSLGLREGEILALLGPNGAGKTTCINMIRGDMALSSGSILLKGINVHKNKRLAQAHLGVCPQFDALDLLTVREHLVFYARCKGVLDIKSDVAFVMSKVGMTAHQHKLASKLSGGQKRKLSLAIALLGNPPVLILDEPSSAMDAASKRVLWKTLEAVAPGRTVLITTHSMEEADALATRAAIIARRLLAIGTTQELRKAHSNEYHVHLILKSAPLSTLEEMQHVADWVVKSFPTCNIQFEGENLGGQVRFIVPADSALPTPAHSIGGEGRQAVSSDTISPLSPTHRGEDKSFVSYLIETLEERKEALGLDCYSIGAATMERVFLSVVNDSDAVEEDDEKISIWRRIGFSRS